MKLSEHHQFSAPKALTKEEKQIIDAYGLYLGVEPERLLVNKLLFEQAMNEYAKSATANLNLIQQLREKLGFNAVIGNRKFSTREIEKNQKAKFYFNHKEYVPITLVRHYDSYSLWKVELHGKMNELKAQMEGSVVFEEQYSIAYKFQTKILDHLVFQNEILIKLPHSDNLIALAKRLHPRIDVQIPAVVKREGKLRENPYYACNVSNLSEGGARIIIEHDIFRLKEQIEIQFKLDNQTIQNIACITDRISFNDKIEYGLKFLQPAPMLQLHIANYVNRYLKE